MLTTLTFLPVAAALLLVFTPKNNQKLLYRLNIALSLVPFVMVIQAWSMFSAPEPILSLSESKEWLPSIGASYSLGLDGINLPFLTLLTFVAIVASLIPPLVGEDLRKRSILLLVWETALIGGFLAQDYVLFLVFWAAGTVPIYFLLEPSSEPHRLFTARSYVLASLVSIVALGGGLLLLTASMDATALAAAELTETIITHLDPKIQWWVFLSIFVGCALRIPIFPFQIWLRLIISQLPVSAGILLVGGFVPLGAYTLLRFALAILPDAVIAFTLVLAAAGAVNLIFGSLAAFGAKNRDQKVAYQVMVYTGIALLGMATLTVNGVSGALYTILALGMVIAFSLTVTHLASTLVSSEDWSLILYGLEAAQQLRLPGFAGFIGLFLVFTTAFRQFPRLSLGIIAGLFLVAIDYARFLAELLEGASSKKEAAKSADPRWTLRSPLLGAGTAAVLLLGGSVLLGLKPELVLGVIEPAINQIMPFLITN